MVQEIPYQGRRFDVIVPGTDVPDWFNQQNIGSSVTIHLAPNWYDRKFKGLAICAVFETHENPTSFTDGPASDIAISCRLEAIESSVTSSFKFLIYGVPSIQSDHLWMGFHSQIGFGKLNWLNKCCLLRALFEPCIPGVEVKKCGVRLVYDQDENEYNCMAVQPSSPCENFGLIYQVPGEPMVVDHDGKLKRTREGYTVAGPCGNGSSNKEEVPNKRLKTFKEN